MPREKNYPPILFLFFFFPSIALVPVTLKMRWFSSCRKPVGSQEVKSQTLEPLRGLGLLSVDSVKIFAALLPLQQNKDVFFFFFLFGVFFSKTSWQSLVVCRQTTSSFFLRSIGASLCWLTAVYEYVWQILLSWNKKIYQTMSRFNRISIRICCPLYWQSQPVGSLICIYFIFQIFFYLFFFPKALRCSAVSRWRPRLLR